MRDPLAADESLRYLRALGDPDRLRIVQVLRAEPKSVGAICAALGSPIANVSHHLRMLKEAGILTASKRGRFVIYRLNQAVATAGAGTHVLDFGCCRVEFGDRAAEGGAPHAAAAAANSGDQALLILNRILGQAQPSRRGDAGGAGAAGGARRSERPHRPTRPAASTSRGKHHAVAIDNPSFERPATAFFDMAVEGWVKEGDPAGTGVFRNFPDDTPLPGSRQVRNADGDQLATLSARNPGTRAGSPCALFQQLRSATYRAGAVYVLTLGVGVSSVQPPTADGTSPPRLRFALTFSDDEGRRQEFAGRSVTPGEVTAGQSVAPAGAAAAESGATESGGRAADSLVYFSVAATVPRSPAPACAGRPIGILITTAENTPAHAGHFILDDVALAVEAAQPASGAASGAGRLAHRARSRSAGGKRRVTP